MAARPWNLDLPRWMGAVALGAFVLLTVVRDKVHRGDLPTWAGVTVQLAVPVGLILLAKRFGTERRRSGAGTAETPPSD